MTGFSIRINASAHELRIGQLWAGVKGQLFVSRLSSAVITTARSNTWAGGGLSAANII